MRLDAKARAASEPVRAPFQEEASFATIAGGASVELSAVTSIRRAPLVAALKIDLPGLSSGIWTKEIWTGDRYVVLYSAAQSVRIAPLVCKPATK
jgi:hypothetical protein